MIHRRTEHAYAEALEWMYPGWRVEYRDGVYAARLADAPGAPVYVEATPDALQCRIVQHDELRFGIRTLLTR